MFEKHFFLIFNHLSFDICQIWPLVILTTIQKTGPNGRILKHYSNLSLSWRAPKFKYPSILNGILKRYSTDLKPWSAKQLSNVYIMATFTKKSMFSFTQMITLRLLSITRSIVWLCIVFYGNILNQLNIEQFIFSFYYI